MLKHIYAPTHPSVFMWETFTVGVHQTKLAHKILCSTLVMRIAKFVNVYILCA